MRGFVQRHKNVLKMASGKITSPTRSLEKTEEMAREFISMLNTYPERNTMNKRNMFVFDETIIGDGCSVPMVIGERRKSAGGNINVIHIREKALGCYISVFNA